MAERKEKVGKPGESWWRVFCLFGDSDVNSLDDSLLKKNTYSRKNGDLNGYSLKTILPPIRKQTETQTNQQNTVDGSEIRLTTQDVVKNPINNGTEFLPTSTG